MARSRRPSEKARSNAWDRAGNLREERDADFDRRCTGCECAPCIDAMDKGICRAVLESITTFSVMLQGGPRGPLGRVMLTSRAKRGTSKTRRALSWLSQPSKFARCASSRPQGCEWLSVTRISLANSPDLPFASPCSLLFSTLCLRWKRSSCTPLTSIAYFDAATIALSLVLRGTSNPLFFCEID